MVTTRSPTRLRKVNFILIHTVHHITLLAQIKLVDIETQYKREIDLTHELANLGWHVRNAVRVIQMQQNRIGLLRYTLCQYYNPQSRHRVIDPQRPNIYFTTQGR